MNGSSTGIARLAAIVAFILVLAAGLGTVLQRIGVPPTILAGLSAAAILIVGTVAGLGGGTMRLPVFLLGRHDLPIAGVGVILAAVVAAGGATSPIVALAGLGLWAVGTAPVLRRTGAPGLAGALGHLYRNPPLRVLLALLVGVSALLSATTSIGDAAGLLGPILGVSPGQALAIVTAAIALVLAPGGLAGASRATIALGIAAVLAIAGMAVFAMADGRLGSEILMRAAGSAPDAGSVQALAILALVVSPQLALLAPAGSADRSVREGGLWAALSAALLATLSGAIAGLPDAQASANLGQALAGLSAQSCVALASALLATQATGLAFGYELRGRVDRRRHSTSKRFAQVRAFVMASAVTAGLLAHMRPTLAQEWLATCGALLVATVGPPLAMACVLPRPGRWSGLLGAVAGLAVSAMLLEGRLAPGWSLPAAALAGLASGLFVGGAAAFMERRSAPPPPRLDEGSL